MAYTHKTHLHNHTTAYNHYGNQYHHRSYAYIPSHLPQASLLGDLAGGRLVLSELHSLLGVRAAHGVQEDAAILPSRGNQLVAAVVSHTHHWEPVTLQGRGVVVSMQTKALSDGYVYGGTLAWKVLTVLLFLMSHSRTVLSSLPVRR